MDMFIPTCRITLRNLNSISIVYLKSRLRAKHLNSECLFITQIIIILIVLHFSQKPLPRKIELCLVLIVIFSGSFFYSCWYYKSRSPISTEAYIHGNHSLVEQLHNINKYFTR